MEDHLLSAIDVLEGGPLLETRPEKTLSELVRERRATPAFSSALVSENDLRRILQAGLGAPSSYNMQPWHSLSSAKSSNESVAQACRHEPGTLGVGAAQASLIRLERE